MIERFVNAFMAAESSLKQQLSAAHPDDYDGLVKTVLAVCATTQGDDFLDVPDVERLTVIDHGDYQGTRLYVVAAAGYQPSTYWTILVDYGSCSGCDAFEAIRRYSDDPPTDEQINEYWTLMLHMVQNMKQIGDTD